MQPAIHILPVLKTLITQCFRHRDQLTQDYSPRSFCQHSLFHKKGESDQAFIQRLLREGGISYVNDIAKVFNKKMQTKRAYMEDQIRTISGWYL